jgi:hypothetical protein
MLHVWKSERKRTCVHVNLSQIDKCTKIFVWDGSCNSCDTTARESLAIFHEEKVTSSKWNLISSTFSAGSAILLRTRGWSYFTSRIFLMQYKYRSLAKWSIISSKASLVRSEASLFFNDGITGWINNPLCTSMKSNIDRRHWLHDRYILNESDFESPIEYFAR